MKMQKMWLKIGVILWVSSGAYANPPKEIKDFSGEGRMASESRTDFGTIDIIYAQEPLLDTFFNRRHIPDSCSVAKVEHSSIQVQAIQRELQVLIGRATGGSMPGNLSQLRFASEKLQSAYLLNILIDKSLGTSPVMVESLVVQRYSELQMGRFDGVLIKRLKEDIQLEYGRLREDRRLRRSELTELNLWLATFIKQNPGVTESLTSLSMEKQAEFKAQQARFESARCQMIKDRVLAYDLRKLQLVSDSGAWSGIEEFAIDQWEDFKYKSSLILPKTRGFDKL